MPLTALPGRRKLSIIFSKPSMVVTIRYLATGDSQQSQSFNFRLGKSTVCQIIKETCDAIWNALNETFLSAPQKKEDWEKIAREFADKWNFPNCLGVLDGKHVDMECSKSQGSTCYKYKGFHSLVLLDVCDANYCFFLVQQKMQMETFLLALGDLLYQQMSQLYIQLRKEVAITSAKVQRQQGRVSRHTLIAKLAQFPGKKNM